MTLAAKLAKEIELNRLWLAQLKQFRSSGVGDRPEHLRAVIAAALAADALSLGAQEVEVVCELSRWAVVGSSEDWLSKGLPQEVGVEQLFRQLTPNPAAGDYAFRHEAHAFAASRDIFFMRAGRLEVINGSADEEAVKIASRFHTAIAFHS